MRIRRLADLEALRSSASRPYLEFLRVDSMSAGLYVLPAGGVDAQLPHVEDEIYVVLGGRSRFTAGDETVTVSQGDVIFVPAAMEHHFLDITEDLSLIVVFAPPEGSAQG